VKDPLTRYRVMAWIVGVGLVVLVLIGVPLKYAANQKLVVEIVGPLHGFLYIVYLLVAFDLAVRRRWPVWKSLVVLAAGTVPFLSFVVERWVTRNDRDQQAQRTVLARS
jgi:integral membrane protein